MKIGIDARLIHATGVGRYINSLIRELSAIDKKNRYVIFLRKADFDSFLPPNERWSICLADVSWHTIHEQIMMPWILSKEHCDIVHVPYFNAPIFYPGRYIVTIHDLTILHVDTGRASTLPYWMYKIRRIGYRIVLGVALKRASQIIAVSQSVKEDIVQSFGISPARISVTYEGIDEIFQSATQVSLKRSPVKGPYFLYVGNVFPHKNIERMIDAYHEYLHTTSAPIPLVFVGSLDFFYQRLEAFVKSRDFTGKLIFLHDVDDQTLKSLYTHATALIFPSSMEGFGLPALEAFACGCRVIASDIPVFHEILGECATYVNTVNINEFARLLHTVSSSRYDREEFQKKASRILDKYSWSTMAAKTIALYDQSAHV